jgi:hypothetical protein
MGPGGLGLGPNPQSPSPIPNPQSPIPTAQLFLIYNNNLLFCFKENKYIIYEKKKFIKYK